MLYFNAPSILRNLYKEIITVVVAHARNLLVLVEETGKAMKLKKNQEIKYFRGL